MRLTRPAARLAIPKILHHTWIGDDPLSEPALEMIAKWRQHHPEWDMRLWTRDNLPPLQNQALYDAFKNTGHRADILRYELMYQFGGVYVDIDMECQKPLDDLIKNCEGFAGRTEPVWQIVGTQYLEIAILGSVPGHSLFARVIDNLPEWYEAHPDYNIPARTGPYYFQKQYLAWRSEGEQYGGLHRDFLLFKPSLFYPYIGAMGAGKDSNKEYPEAYAIHRWWSSWVPKNDALEVTSGKVS